MYLDPKEMRRVMDKQVAPMRINKDQEIKINMNSNK
jgi:hypothetical protein